MTFNLRRGGAAAGMAAVLLVVLAFAAQSAFADTLYPQPRGNAWTQNSQSYVSAPKPATQCATLAGVLPDTLCYVENIHDETQGTPPGALRTNFNFVAGLLGLIAGTGKFVQTFPFTVTEAPTGPGTFHIDRKYLATGLINSGASIRYTVDVIDNGTNAKTTLIDQTIDSTNAANWSTQTRGIGQNVLQVGHSYHIEITSSTAPTLSLAQVQLSSLYDNLYLRMPDASPNFVSKPGVKTLPATDINAGEATLNSEVNPYGNATSMHYELGTTTAYGKSLPTTELNIGDDLSAVSPNAVRATGLAQCTTYHYRAVASNTVGRTDGNDQTFSTWCSPTAQTLDASSISATTAILNGGVTPNGPLATYHYDFGKDNSYGAGTTERTAGLGFSLFQPLSEPVAGLAPQTTYHFRITAHNALGSASGNDVTFTTPPLTGPQGATGSAGTPGSTGAAGTPGKQGAPGVSGSSTNTTITNDSGLLRIRASLVKVGTAGRRRSQVRLPIFCTRKTGRTCAGTVKVRTIGRINPSATKVKPKRRVTFLTFEYQLAAGKKGYAISNMNIEKLQLIEKIKSVAVSISVQVTDSGGNRQTIVKRGTLRAVRSP
jgi:hypothetical protein